MCPIAGQMCDTESFMPVRMITSVEWISSLQLALTYRVPSHPSTPVQCSPTTDACWGKTPGQMKVKGATPCLRLLKQPVKCLCNHLVIYKSLFEVWKCLRLRQFCFPSRWRRRSVCSQVCQQEDMRPWLLQTSTQTWFSQKIWSKKLDWQVCDANAWASRSSGTFRLRELKNPTVV